jgi:hypothetical protein
MRVASSIGLAILLSACNSPRHFLSGVAGAAGIAGAEQGEAGNSEASAAGEGGAVGAAECEPGDLGCDGLTPVSCQDGQLSPSGPACAYSCQKGACAGECAVDATRCEGKIFETCGAGNTWGSGTSCQYVCDDMQGCIGDCKPGTPKCASATEFDVCSDQGAFEKSADCDLECATVAGNPECVECTSGDGLCPGGCTHPEDSDCAVDVLAHCPNIYFGLGRYKAPQPADFANTSISALPTMKVGTVQLIGISIYNHGFDPSPPVTLEVRWGDPTDGCVNNLQLINESGFDSVPGASLSPSLDGLVTTNVGFAPDASALATNGGHICLIALMYETVAPSGSGCVQQSNNGVTPATDPLSAVLDVQVVPAN